MRLIRGLIETSILHKASPATRSDRLPRSNASRKRAVAFSTIVVGLGMLIVATLLLIDARGREAGAETLSLPEITCDDFSSWDAASEFFADLEPGSNASRVLDSNRDGVPCEGMMPHSRQTHEMFDVICDDFQHRDEAEYFFEVYETSGENRFGLDRDLDGRPCELLPPLEDINRVLSRLNRIWNQDDQSEADRDCNDFETWIEANEFFIQAGGSDSDPHRLDGDSNGIPCESLPGAP